MNTLRLAARLVWEMRRPLLCLFGLFVIASIVAILERALDYL